MHLMHLLQGLFTPAKSQTMKTQVIDIVRSKLRYDVQLPLVDPAAEIV